MRAVSAIRSILGLAGAAVGLILTLAVMASERIQAATVRLTGGQSVRVTLLEAAAGVLSLLVALTFVLVVLVGVHQSTLGIGVTAAAMAFGAATLLVDEWRPVVAVVARVALVCAGAVVLGRAVGLPEPPDDLSLRALGHYYRVNWLRELAFASSGWLTLNALLALWHQASKRAASRSEGVGRFLGAVLLMIALAWQIKVAVDSQETTDRVQCLEKALAASSRQAAPPACLLDRTDGG